MMRKLPALVPVSPGGSGPGYGAFWTQEAHLPINGQCRETGEDLETEGALEM